VQGFFAESDESVTHATRLRVEAPLK
jgi:hypothetical protein